MNLRLNPENKYLVLNEDYLLLSNKSQNLIMAKSDFYNLKHNLSLNLNVDAIFINLNIVLYDFQDFRLLNQEKKIYSKILFKNISKEKFDYLKYDSRIYVYYNKNVLFTVTYWDLLQILKCKKITLFYILKNNYYQTLLTRSVLLFHLFSKKDFRCLYVCSAPFFSMKKISVDKIFFLVRNKKNDLFCKNKKIVNFENQILNSNCSECSYLHICGGNSMYLLKNCRKIKRIIKKSFMEELKK